jgi:hypothetical protein
MRIKQTPPDILIIRVNTLAFLPGFIGGVAMLVGALVLGGALLFSFDTLDSPIVAAVLMLVLLLASGGAFYFALHAQRITWVFNRQKDGILLQRASVLHSETHELPLRNARVSRRFGEVTLYAGGESWTIEVRHDLRREAEIEMLEHFLAQS